MLNKNQSNKRSSWKYSLVIPALIAFVFLFQIKVVAQEKVILLPDGSQISSTTKEVTEMSWTKDSSDEEFKNDAAFMAKSNLFFNFSDIKRNSKGEITSIKISFKDKLGNSGIKEFISNKPIKPVLFRRSIDQNGKGEIGFYESIDAMDVTISNEKNNGDIEKPIDSLSNIKKNKNGWSFKEMIENNKNYLIFIDGIKQDNNNPILISLDREIDKITKINETDKLAKYGEEGKNGVAIIETKKIKKDTDNSKTYEKSNIITLENGDEILVMNNSFKIPSHPTIYFTNNTPELVINGNPQINPKATLEIIDIKKIKSIKVLDENNQETEGSIIKKMIILTK